MDRYQSGLGQPGTMPTEAWFAALMRGVDGPLGRVIDVGCAEGVMCMLALASGATDVLGIGLHDDRMVAARNLADRLGGLVAIREMRAADLDERADTIIYSMMAHWLGRAETLRIAALANRWFLVVFRLANENYARPQNGTWFPTLEEFDGVVRGIRTHEELLLTQDNDKQVWAATYRTDMWRHGDWICKRHEGFNRHGWAELLTAGAPFSARLTDAGYCMPRYDGLDLHGDEPFRPRHGRPVIHDPSVDVLASQIAGAALKCGWYPTDFSPRNIIVGDGIAHLVDLGEIERTDGTVPEPYRSIWELSLGRPFSGNLADLL